MKDTNVSLGVYNGGPFDGLPCFSLDVTEGMSEPNSIILEMLESIPPVTLLNIIVGRKIENDDALRYLIERSNALGLITCVESYITPQPFMALFQWKRYHTDTEIFPYGASEIIFHTKLPPTFRPTALQNKQLPILYWAFEGAVNAALPKLQTNMRIYRK